MPRKLRYNIIREPPKDAGTNAGTEETTMKMALRMTSLVYRPQKPALQQSQLTNCLLTVGLHIPRPYVLTVSSPALLLT
ncbi:uncharacterized protein DS421_13g411570 [Arachis hypogaea]|nr:uncharacterized protein DS421_13g411570 [Arachis hypogaea]